jgi:hypothetical protein
VTGGELRPLAERREIWARKAQERRLAAELGRTPARPVGPVGDLMRIPPAGRDTVNARKFLAWCRRKHPELVEQFLDQQ